MKFPPNWHTVEQGTPEWLALRCGKITASMVSDVFAEGTGKSRENAMADLVTEILTGKPIDESFQSFDMARGKELEPIARSNYEALREVYVEQLGFADHPSIARYGCSPDGLVEINGELGAVEIKCPKRNTHLQTIQGKDVAKVYKDQMLAQMDVLDLAWVDFVSFCPDFPDGMSLFVKRFMRDESEIIARRIKIQAFIREAEEIAESLRRKFG